MPLTALILTPEERSALEQLARSRKGRAEIARRAHAILWLADGATYPMLTGRLGWSSRTTALWKGRFLAERVAGLRSRHQGSKPRVLTPRTEARILAWTTQRRPADGSTHWSTR